MNLSFHKLLALVYFKNQAENYDLSELRSILGFTQIQLDKMLSELFENEYLVYKNYEMSVSEKGLNYLKKKNAEKYELASNDINLSVIT